MRKMKKLFLEAVLLLTVAAASAQTPMPNAHVLLDLTKTQLFWTWTRGIGPATLGFKIYCGTSTNLTAPSPTGQTMTDATMVDVPDPTARNYLIGPVIMPLLTDYGTKTANYAKLANILCVVSPYNKAGESVDGIVGTPLKVTAVYFQVRN